MAQQTVVVLGASGASGLLFLREALAGPAPVPHLVAYVRTPSKIPADIAQKITIVQGHLRDSNALDKALQGADVLVSFLGPSDFALKNAITRDFSAPIADAMRDVIIPRAKANNVKRIIFLGTASYELPSEQGKVSPVLRFARFMLYLFVPTGYAEMQNIGKTVTSLAESLDLDFTLFRVPFLYDEKPDSPIKSVDAGRFGQGYRGGTFLSRQNIARWVLREIKEQRYSRQVVSIGETD